MGNAFSSALSNLGNVLIAPLNGIKSLVSNMGTAVSSMSSAVANIPSNVGNATQAMLKTLFIPSDDYFQNHFNTIKSKLYTRLSVTSYEALFNDVRNAKVGVFDDIKISSYKVGNSNISLDTTIVDSKPINDAKPWYYPWVRGTVFILLIVYNYNQIYKLIRGTDMVSVGTTVSNMKGSDKS